MYRIAKIMVKVNSHHRNTEYFFGGRVRKTDFVLILQHDNSEFWKPLSHICAVQGKIGPVRATVISKLTTIKTTKHTERQVLLKMSLCVLFIYISSYFLQTK